MFQLQSKTIFFLVLLGGVYALAWLIQDNLFLNWDVSQLVRVTRLLLAGGTYTGNFFEPNPPMILFIYSPPVFFSQFFNLNFILVFRTYIFLLSTFSLLGCYYFFIRLFPGRQFFIIVILMVFLIVPMYQFGQREHLLFIFSMPYLFLVAYRLNGNAIAMHYAIIIGLFAGFGFAIKPYFLMPFLLIECYYLLCKKRWTACFRAEVISIFGLVLVYLFVVFVFFKDFVFSVMPYMMKFYYSSLRNSWESLVFHPMTLFCLFPLGLYIALFHSIKKPYKTLCSLWTVALIGFLFVYFLQRTPYVYHLIPAFSIAILLQTLLFSLFLEMYFSSFVIVLAVFMSFFPGDIVYHLYDFGLTYKKNVLNKLIEFVHTQPEKQFFYILSSAGHYGTPLIDYTNATFAGRFDCFWMVGNLVRDAHLKGSEFLRHEIRNNTDTDFFVNRVTEDLHLYKPAWVWVDVRHPNNVVDGQPFYFDYLDYFSENPRFRGEWKAYRYVTTISGGGSSFYLNYNFKIYQRI